MVAYAAASTCQNHTTCCLACCICQHPRTDTHRPELQHLTQHLIRHQTQMPAVPTCKDLVQSCLAYCICQRTKHATAAATATFTNTACQQRSPTCKDLVH
jgi:hypothetical protein